MLKVLKNFGENQMACVSTRKVKNGVVYDIQFYLSSNKKRTIYGFTNRRNAERFGDKLDRLIELQRIGENDKDVTKWLISLASSDMERYDKLVSFGLAEKRVVSGTLEKLVEMFVTNREVPSCGKKDLKERTLLNRRTIMNHVVRFFGADKLVSSFCIDDAYAFMEHVQGVGARATWGRGLPTVKQCFELAVSAGWIKENPFRSLKGSNTANSKRQYFVTLEESEKVLDACGNSLERLLFVLARFGGLRIPSEIQYMNWSDIDLNGVSFIVKIPKKTGKRAQERQEFVTRSVPMFPELRKAFNEYYEDLPEGCPDRVFSGISILNSTLRRRFKAILTRAKVKVWPKLFQNMRSTRETELDRCFAIQSASTWIGNTPDVAQKHYLQVLDEDFKRASCTPTLMADESTSDRISTKEGILPAKTMPFEDERKRALELINRYFDDPESIPENVRKKIGIIIGMQRLAK